MRQRCRDNALATVAFLLKDKIIFQISRISRALLGMSCSAQVKPLETLGWMKAHEWACLCVRAQMCFAVICCVKVLVPRMLFVVSGL